MRLPISVFWLVALALTAPHTALASGITGVELIQRFAGTGGAFSSGDGGPALAATLTPYGLAFDVFGNLYVADADNHVVRRIDPNGVITRFAGTGTAGFSGDGGPAVQATLYAPAGVAVDADRNVYIADASNHRIRRVDAQTGTIRTITGSAPGLAGDGGPAAQALLRNPLGVAVAPDRTVYIADTGNNRVRRIDVGGNIQAVAGNGGSPGLGDAGPALQSTLNRPEHVIVDGAGTVYVADHGNGRVRWIDANQVIHTYAGGGVLSPLSTGTPPLQTVFSPRSLARDADGNLYVVDQGLSFHVLKVDPARTVLTRVIGEGVRGPAFDGVAQREYLDRPFGVAVDVLGSVYVADTGNRQVRKVTAPPQPADLAVTKMCTPNPASTGQDVRCEITVTNGGPGGAASVQVTDTLTFVPMPGSPPGVVTVGSASSPHGTCSTPAPDRVACDLGGLGSGERATVTVTVRANQGGTIRDTVTTETQSDPNSSNNAATWDTAITATAADLSITKEAAQPAVTVGRAVRYLIRITNHGPGDATNVRATDISQGSSAAQVVGTTPGTSCVGALPIVCTTAQLANGAVADVTLSVTPGATGQFCNAVVVTADQPEPDLTTLANNAPPSACVAVVRQLSIGEFVAFGGEWTEIGTGSSVVSGSIGTNTQRPGDATALRISGALVLDASSLVVADTVHLVDARVREVSTNHLVSEGTTTVTAQSLPGSFPLLTPPPFSSAVPRTGPSDDVVVANHATRILSPGRYRNVTVGRGGTLALRGWVSTVASLGRPPDGQVYDFATLLLAAGARVVFAPPPSNTLARSVLLGMSVRVQDWIRTAAAVTIGPPAGPGPLNGSHIVFYVGGADRPCCDEFAPRFIVTIGRDNRVRANIYAPNGTVALGDRFRGTGAFIGKRVQGGLNLRLELESAFR